MSSGAGVQASTENLTGAEDAYAAILTEHSCYPAGARRACAR
jgi:hypothetical protein